MSLTTYDHVLPDTSDFTDNGIAVDPRGCGCTDCLVGTAITLNSRLVADLAMEHFHPAIRRVIHNRSGHNLFAICQQREVSNQAFAEHDLRRHFAFSLTDRFPMDFRATVEQIHTH